MIYSGGQLEAEVPDVDLAALCCGALGSWARSPR